MYNEEVIIEMKNKHKALLKSQDDWVELMDWYLLEQPFPQSLLSHVSSYFITRFHRSMLALQLLSLSGYCDEAYGVLRMMVEYTITLKFIKKNPEERVAQFMDDTEVVNRHNSDSDILTMADETQMLYWFTSIPHLSTDLGEVFLSIGPTPFNAEELLTQSCHLTAIILGCALEINTHDKVQSQNLKNKLDLLLADVKEFKKGECIC